MTALPITQGSRQVRVNRRSRAGLHTNHWRRFSIYSLCDSRSILFACTSFCQTLKDIMLPHKTSGLSALVLSLTLAGPAAAVPVYEEATNGDFSNNRAAPTLVNFTLGQNDVFGQTGSVSGVTDRDYFTFIVPAGSTLSSLTVLNSSLTAGGAAFFGLQAGAVVTVDPAAASAAPLLGYELVSPADIGVDILPVMSTAAGAGGFTPPLGEGQYSA